MNKYNPPRITGERAYETSALACVKTFPMPAGSHHFSSAYDTFTGHKGPAFGGDSSETLTAVGIGGGPGQTSWSNAYSGLCNSWMSLMT